MSSNHKAWVALAAALMGAGCGGDETAPGDEVCGGADTTGCAAVLEPSGGDDTTPVQEALIEASSGDRICFCPGSYAFSKELSLTVPNVTVSGLGPSRDDVVLDFATQTVGDDGFTVTSDGFTIEHLSLKNTPGNGIVVTGADDVTFRDLKVSWDAGSVTDNGAYAVYPVSSNRVIVEDSEVVGAADAGIYVGQCNQAIVRNNVVYGNVAGIEIENTLDAEVYGNEAYDNTAGILVFVLPNLEQKDGARCKVHDNVVRDNNRANFGEEGTVVASVPAGTGMLILAADDTELHDNTITGNASTALLVVSHGSLGVLIPGFMPDPDTDGFPERTHFHDNTLADNGTAPKDAASFLNVTPLEDVVWDGIENQDPADPVNATAELCFGSAPPPFRNFGGVAGISDPMLHSTDTTPHECSLPELASLSW